MPRLTAAAVRAVTLIAVLFITACTTATPSATTAPQPTSAELPATTAPTASPTSPAGGGAAAATATPTVPAAPTDTPAPPAAAPVDLAASGLPGALWTWTRSARPALGGGESLTVADPLRYTLQFDPSGKLQTQADCNTASGSYTLAGNGALALNVGAMTKMACPPGSLGSEFALELGQVSAYQLNEGYLELGLQGGGSMQFAPQIILSFPAPAEGAASAGAEANVPVRLGPGDSYPAYGVLPAGAQAEIVGKFTPWWALRLPGYPAGIGWVKQGTVRAENYAAVPSLPAPAEDFGHSYPLPRLDDPQVLLTDPQLILAGPGEEYPPISAALTGASLFVIGRDAPGRYWKVYLPPEVVPAASGWILASAVHATHTENVPVVPVLPGAAATRFPKAEAGGALAAPYVTINLRAGPGEWFSVLDFALKGQLLAVTGRTVDGMWLQVKVSPSVSATGFAWVMEPNVRLFAAENVQVVATPLPDWIPADITSAACALTYQSPANGRVFRPNEDFTVEIEVKNTTAKTWSSGDVDLAFVTALGGGPLHSGADAYDLSRSVLPGETYRFTIRAAAPFDWGDFGEVWAFTRGSEPICSFSYNIHINPPPPTPTFTAWPTVTGTIEPTAPPDVPPTPTKGTPEPTNPPEVSPTPKW